MTDLQAQIQSNETSEVTFEFSKWEDVDERKYFSPDELEAASEYIYAMQSVMPDEVTLVSWTGDELPDGYGMHIVQLRREMVVNQVDDDSASEKKKVRVPYAIIVWPVPSVELFQVNSKGSEYILNEINSALADQIVRPLRNKDASEFEMLKTEIPFNILDYAENSRKGSGIYGVYNELAKDAVKKIKGHKTLGKTSFGRNLTPQILRTCLSSKAAANSLAKQLEDIGFFSNILNELQNAAEALGKPVTVFEDWRSTREDTEEFSGDLELDGFTLDL